MQTSKGGKMLIFLDLETTGLEVEDKICSIALLAVDALDKTPLYDLVNEGKKISVKASSINHITNEMLRDKPALKESGAYKFLQEHNYEHNTLIGHNIKFDVAFLREAGFEFLGNVVDTLRVTKHLIPECELYGLQTLRYELKLYKEEMREKLAFGVDEKLCAHHALCDALVVKLLYDYLLEIAPLERMIALSFENVLMQKLPFGKYEGKYIEDVAINDRNYLEWMLHNISDLDEDLHYSISYYL
jgi:DNA polymerase-3 subunit epsilon/exodeoxyribonuclease X